MRAIAVRKFKDVPSLMDLPKPAPAAGEILVHLGAASVNPFDWKIADGTLESVMPHEFPLILGVDGAGVVEAVGEGVSRFAVGDGVFGQFLHPPAGRGTYAEYVAAPELLAIAKMPRGMYSYQGAAVPTAGMTALEALDALALTKGQKLLIIGAAGGVGGFVTQLASNRGILALAASRGSANRDFLHKFGAYRHFDSSSTRFVEDVKLAYPAGVDALLDLHNVGEAFAANLPLVRSGGTVASTIRQATEAVAAPFGLKAINVNLEPRAELLEQIATDFASGRLRIPVEDRVPLAEAPQAIERSRAGGARGKVVLNI
jgi:NADPH:quinone reductase